MNLPAGIPISYTFCQKCGFDINIEAPSIEGYCKCDNAMLTSWVAKNSNIIHLVQGLNYMIIGQSTTIQSCLEQSIIYEL